MAAVRRVGLRRDRQARCARPGRVDYRRRRVRPAKRVDRPGHSQRFL